MSLSKSICAPRSSRRHQIVATSGRQGNEVATVVRLVGRARPTGIEVLAGLQAGEDVALDPVRAAIELKRSHTDGRRDG